MKLADSRSNYRSYSTKAGELVRQLAFAGLGVVWIFRAAEPNRIAIPAALRWPSILFVLALSFDFLQAVSGSVIWGLYSRRMELKVDEATEFHPRREINWPANLLLYAKITCILVGYALLLRFLLKGL